MYHKSLDTMADFVYICNIILRKCSALFIQYATLFFRRFKCEAKVHSGLYD